MIYLITFISVLQYVPHHTKNTTVSGVTLSHKVFGESTDLIKYTEEKIKAQHPDAKPRYGYVTYTYLIGIHQ